MNADVRQDYLDLLKLVLTGLADMAPTAMERAPRRTVQSVPLSDFDARREGRDWPANGYTMVGLDRLTNLQACIEEVLADEVPGDFIETGVWRGGASMFMRGVLKAHGVKDRVVVVADSFEGLPDPDIERYPADQRERLHLWGKVPVGPAGSGRGELSPPRAPGRPGPVLEGVVSGHDAQPRRPHVGRDPLGR